MPVKAALLLIGFFGLFPCSFAHKKEVEFPKSAGTFEAQFEYGSIASWTTPLSTRLIYRELDSDPVHDPVIQKLIASPDYKGLTVQFALETNFLPNRDLVRAIRGGGKLSGKSVHYLLTSSVAETVITKFNERSEAGTLPPGVRATRQADGSVVLTLQDQYLDFIYTRLMGWAQFFKTLQEPVYVRPLSEMNLDDAVWELNAPGVENTPAEYAQAWTELHHIMAGPKTLFLFDVSTWLDSGVVYIDPGVKVILSKVSTGSIDGLGIHAYEHAIGTLAAQLDPWIAFFKSKPALRSKPIVLGEMGIAKNAPTQANSQERDKQRAQWISDSFNYACSMKIQMVTYYDGWDGEWDYSIEPATAPVSFAALDRAMSDYSHCK